MNFDEPTIGQLRHPYSLKWNLFPDSTGMFVAEMDFGLAPEVSAVVHKFAQAPSIGYLHPADYAELRTATATWLESHGNWQVSPEQVHITPDILSAARLAINELTPADSAVILPTPAYMGFMSLIPRMGRKLIEVPNVKRAGRDELDLMAIEAALTAGARTLILVNPANPTGRVYSRDELLALDALMARFPDSRVISDDVHAPFALHAPWVPYASISNNAARQTLTFISASKGWNIPGLKCAQVITSNPEDATRLNSVLDMLEGATSSVGVHASIAAYRDGGMWLDQVREYLRDNLALVEQWAQETPRVHVAHNEGTYIVFLDFSTARKSGVIPADQSVSSFLREQAGVALTNGQACGSHYADYARMIVATPRPILQQALDAIGAVLAKTA
ncbi:MAG: aminotransferase class I/II-fold pyridoxal phosphate-dependent enzyme [Actinomycetaceae bacterium]|nr:aminotransferase class I/II-fold pyridoxal phosphate-dependent enzyme [Actinomycetaceae bacterium]